MGTIPGWSETGDDVAAAKRWNAYFDCLVHLAHCDCRPSSFCRGVENKKFPALTERHGLWRLLVSITVHKLLNAVRESDGTMVPSYVAWDHCPEPSPRVNNHTKLCLGHGFKVTLYQQNWTTRFCGSVVICAQSFVLTCLTELQFLRWYILPFS